MAGSVACLCHFFPQLYKNNASSTESNRLPACLPNRPIAFLETSPELSCCITPHVRIRARLCVALFSILGFLGILFSLRPGRCSGCMKRTFLGSSMENIYTDNAAHTPKHWHRSQSPYERLRLVYLSICWWQSESLK